MLFFYTDGLTGACGPNMVYFEDRLTDELAALAGQPPAALVVAGAGSWRSSSAGASCGTT